MKIYHPVDRRTCIKGFTLGAGAAVLQPFLNLLAAEEAGQGPPPRIVFLFQSNGLYGRHVQPEGMDAKEAQHSDRLTDVTLADLQLPDAISPLAPLKERMSIVLGLSAKQAYPNHGAAYGALGLYNARRSGANGNFSEALGQTVDHALAGSLPGVIPVVGLGVHANPETIFANTVSATSAKRPLPIVCQPEIAFQSLFGSVAEGSAGKVFNSRNKLLDWVRSDIKRVRGELPATARERLDIYLESFEQMRSRQDKIATFEDRLKAHRPANDKFDSPLKTDRFEAQCALTASVLASGLTNVVVLDASCGPQNYKTWTELGINADGHSIGHTSGHGSDAQDKHAVPIRKYHCQRVADLAKRLDAIPEGDGTLLDNTLIVYLSDSAESHHGSGHEWPMILVGNLGGRLKTKGRFLQFPKYGADGHRTMENFYLSLLHAVGDRRDKFGHKDSGLNDIDTSGPLAEIMA